MYPQKDLGMEIAYFVFLTIYTSHLQTYIMFCRRASTRQKRVDFLLRVRNPTLNSVVDFILYISRRYLFPQSNLAQLQLEMADHFRTSWAKMRIRRYSNLCRNTAATALIITNKSAPESDVYRRQIADEDD
jgi:hypothetical protein